MLTTCSVISKRSQNSKHMHIENSVFKNKCQFIKQRLSILNYSTRATKIPKCNRFLVTNNWVWICAHKLKITCSHIPLLIPLTSLSLNIFLLLTLWLLKFHLPEFHRRHFNFISDQVFGKQLFNKMSQLLPSHSLEKSQFCIATSGFVTWGRYTSIYIKMHVNDNLAVYPETHLRTRHFFSQINQNLKWRHKSIILTLIWTYYVFSFLNCS